LVLPGRRPRKLNRYGPRIVLLAQLIEHQAERLGAIAGRIWDGRLCRLPVPRQLRAHIGRVGGFARRFAIPRHLVPCGEPFMCDYP
jgi:hypothetical protein